MESPTNLGPLSEWATLVTTIVGFLIVQFTGIVWSTSSAFSKLKGLSAKSVETERKVQSLTAVVTRESERVRAHDTLLVSLDHKAQSHDATLEKLSTKLDTSLAGLNSQLSDLKSEISSVSRGQARIEGMLSNLVPTKNLSGQP